MELGKELTKMIETIMPPNAEILVNSKSRSYDAHISWKTADDNERKNKRSKKIIIVVPYDVLDDMENLSVSKKEAVINRIKSHISKNLASFNPNHNEPHGALDPEVTWEIDSEIAGLLD